MSVGMVCALTTHGFSKGSVMAQKLDARIGATSDGGRGAAGCGGGSRSGLWRGRNVHQQLSENSETFAERRGYD